MFLVCTTFFYVIYKCENMLYEWLDFSICVYFPHLLKHGVQRVVTIR